MIKLSSGRCMRSLILGGLLALPFALAACGGETEEGPLVNAPRRPSTVKADDTNGGGERVRGISGRRLRDVDVAPSTCRALAACCERVPDLLKPSCETNVDQAREEACGDDLRAFSAICGID